MSARVKAWEALPWEDRMALLDFLAGEAAAFRHEAGADPAPICERYRALATTWETARALLMRADTVTAKDKTQAEYEAERATYETPRPPERSATLAKLRDAISNPPDGDDDAWKSAMRAALREHEAAIAETAPPPEVA